MVQFSLLRKKPPNEKKKKRTGHGFNKNSEGDVTGISKFGIHEVLSTGTSRPPLGGGDRLEPTFDSSKL